MSANLAVHSKHIVESEYMQTSYNDYDSLIDTLYEYDGVYGFDHFYCSDDNSTIEVSKQDVVNMLEYTIDELFTMSDEVRQMINFLLEECDPDNDIIYIELWS